MPDCPCPTVNHKLCEHQRERINAMAPTFSFSDQWPPATCQHRWETSPIVLTVSPPIYQQACRLCGARRRVQDGKVISYTEGTR
jgi:hypothetical protein